jgi:hypothetical protein
MARNPNTTVSGEPFDKATVEAVWRNAKEDPGYTIFKRDTCGAVIKHNDYGKTDTFGWEIDHSKPVSKDGTDDLDNLQALHWVNNRYKGDDYPDWRCRKKY